MPNLVEWNSCCGCGSCANKCPKNAISMSPNKEGFLHPEIDKNLCVECGACEKVCPGLEPAKNTDNNPKAFIVQHNRQFGDRDKKHAMFLFELVCKHNIELLEEADVIAESEKPDAKSFNDITQSSSEEITLDLIKRMVDWDRRRRILKDWQWSVMNEVVQGKRSLTDQMKCIFYTNLEKLKITKIW